MSDLPILSRASAGQPAARLDPRVADITSSLTRREWDELADIVMRRMERVMVDELARRGRRAMPRGL